MACAVFCFFGNFNAIYSRYNRDELFKKELEKHRQELTAITTSSIEALLKVDTVSSGLQKRVESLKGQLIMQINDPANLGLGIRANSLITEIETELGQKLTQFSGTASQKALSYSNNIERILNQRLQHSKKHNAEN
jgi:hypothetical protein